MTVHHWAAALTALPKVELCVHLEGTMRPDTVRELARKNGLRPPLSPLNGVFEYRDRREFRDVAALLQGLVRTRQDWALISYESTLDAARNGVVHREVSFSPARHLASGVALPDIVAGIDDGMAAGEKDTGVVTRMICNLDAELGETAAREQVDGLVRVRRDRSRGAERVIGIGIDGVDPDSNAAASVLASFVAVYDAARAGGLHRTADVGSTPGPAIEAALDQLGCERIDQGTRVLDEPRLVARMVDERIPLNLSPSTDASVVPASRDLLAGHGFAELRAAGLLVTLNSADPSLTGVSLAEEYRTMSRAFGLDWDSMVALAQASVEAAWLADDDRRRLNERIAGSAATLRPAA